MDPSMRLLGSTDTILPYARDYAFYILIAGPAFTSSCVMNNILRYEGKAFYAMIGLTSGGILNIFGDAFLINVLHMGISGAGLSTAVSQYISMIILAVPFIWGQVQSSLSPRYFRFSWKTMGDIVYVGFPSLMRQGLNAVSTMILNSCAGVYGDAAVAAISIVNRIMMFMLCMTIGIGQGFQPVSAFNYGAGKYSRVKEGFVFSLKFSTVLMVIATAAGWIWAPELVTIFRDDPEVIEIGTTAMQFRCISLVFLPMSVNGNMLFQSIGKGGTATFLAALRSGIILIPLVIILSADWAVLKFRRAFQSSSRRSSQHHSAWHFSRDSRLTSPADIPGWHPWQKVQADIPGSRQPWKTVRRMVGKAEQIFVI